MFLLLIETVPWRYILQFVTVLIIKGNKNIKK